MNRRHFLASSGAGLCAMALESLLNPLGAAADAGQHPRQTPLVHHLPKAKRIIFLFQSGGPSQHELFDYKPLLNEWEGRDLPSSVMSARLVPGFTAAQSRYRVAGARWKFHKRGECGAWVSELLPHTARIVDELCVIKSVHTDAINHDPAITQFQTGNQVAGSPSLGSWLSYALGSANDNLPAFTVLISRGTGRPEDQPLFARLWGSGFLQSRHQGIQLRSSKDPVLHLNDPDGLSRPARRAMLSTLGALDRLHHHEFGDPEIDSRAAQYRLAERMQSSIPEVADISDEPESTFSLYGEDARTPGTYAANCLLARRLAERDVRFIQLYHMGWDQHDNIPAQLPMQCKDVDQASAALVMDLKQRGLLEDTLLIWGGEFGRTAYCQGPLTAGTYGRDHHAGSFTIWLAGGGVQAGSSVGETDEFGVNIIENPVHVHDVQATVLHLMGLDHERLTYPDQGRQARLTNNRGKLIIGVS